MNFQDRLFSFLVLDGKAYEKLSRWIVSEFPTPTTPNVMDTVSLRLLRRLSSSLLFAEYPSAADTPKDLRVFWREVDLSFNVLKELEENANSALTSGNISPISRKKGKATSKNRRINPLPFDSIGIPVPTTDMEVRDVYVGILPQLQSILEVCVSIASGPRAELNVHSTTSSFSGSHWCQQYSNPRTPEQTYRRKEHLPQQRRQRFLGQISLRAQRSL